MQNIYDLNPFPLNENNIEEYPLADVEEAMKRVIPDKLHDYLPDDKLCRQIFGEIMDEIVDELAAVREKSAGWVL